MPPISIDTPDDTLNSIAMIEAMNRGIIRINGNTIEYYLNHEKKYDWTDPEEWVRAYTVSWLIIDRGYPANRLRLEVTVPRRTPSDHADIVVYRDDACREPYLIVENKSCGQSASGRDQGIEQAFGNTNSLRAPLTLYDEGALSYTFDVANHPPTERNANRLGNRDVLPKQYGDVPTYAYVAGQPGDIAPVPSAQLEARIRRAHSLIWAGGRRDPLMAFDEWSKLLFTKVADERTTPTGEPRRFQVGTKETTATVANRIHALFAQSCQVDPTIFQSGTRINLPDSKIYDVVRVIQEIALTRTDIDSIGRAFEQFFGSIFRGGLGQYFTMRQLSRFIVAALDINHGDFVLDPTSGSGGFLLEVLLQVWHGIDDKFAGQDAGHVQRLKIDFALNHVFGIEIHEILARICKINLLLHHDGHTNIEANRSCFDIIFNNSRLIEHQARFSRIVGNPPFGTDIKFGDEEQLGANKLSNFTLARGLRTIDSEQLIIERCIDFLEPGGKFGLILPDGLFNNQGERSNCPRTRAFLAMNGKILSIISLPDHAFRKSGAQNKTSILLFQKFSKSEKRLVDRNLSRLAPGGVNEDQQIVAAVKAANLDYRVFLGEANEVGYTPAGSYTSRNDLFKGDMNGVLDVAQEGTILQEWRQFCATPSTYSGSTIPDCMAVTFSDLWVAHSSHRLDPKYHLFKREATKHVRSGWVKATIGQVMRKREDEADFVSDPDRLFQVMTIGQTGEIRARQAGKGRNPPEWRASYFDASPGTWYSARANDVVYSSIDLWKGCISTVPESFDGALVTHEFPIYEVIDHRISPEFLKNLLRSRYYQRAFRAITTGHSNRRRTQVEDFEQLEIAFPPTRCEQAELIKNIVHASELSRSASQSLRLELLDFSALIDGRGREELPEVEEEDDI